MQNEQVVLQWMVDQGLTAEEATTAMRRGRLFLKNASPETLQPKVDYLRSIGVQNIRNILFKRPTTVGMRLESLQSKVEFLKKEYELTEPEIARIVSSAPAFLSLKASVLRSD